MSFKNKHPDFEDYGEIFSPLEADISEKTRFSKIYSYSRAKDEEVEFENIQDLFSPLEADLSLQTRFSKMSEASGLVSDTISPIWESYHEDTSYISPMSPSSRISIPRKPIGTYEKLQHQPSVYHENLQESFEDIRLQRQRTISFDAPKSNYEPARVQHQQTNSTSTTQSDHTVLDTNEEKEENSVMKRGWRFYGTFACLATVTLVCAIDATILSVALPVSKYHDFG